MNEENFRGLDPEWPPEADWDEYEAFFPESLPGDFPPDDFPPDPRQEPKADWGVSLLGVRARPEEGPPF